MLSHFIRLIGCRLIRAHVSFEKRGVVALAVKNVLLVGSLEKNRIVLVAQKVANRENAGMEETLQQFESLWSFVCVCCSL